MELEPRYSLESWQRACARSQKWASTARVKADARKRKMKFGKLLFWEFILIFGMLLLIFFLG